jgi:Uma2 family endonuclease
MLRMTVDQYLRYDRDDPWKNEYDDGFVYAVPSANHRHNLILGSLYGALRRVPDCCVVYASRMKVRMEKPTRIFFPDATIVCGESVVAGEGDDEMLLNPTAVFELRGPRLDCYATIESLQEYAVVSVDEYRVEHFQRGVDDWIRSTVSGIESTLALPVVGCEVPLREIYRQVLESPLD